MVRIMAGIKNRGSQIHRVKNKYKRDKRVELTEIDKTEEKFLKSINSNILDSGGEIPLDYDFQKDEVEKLVTDDQIYD
jgi:hypothetical protein